MNQNYLPEVAAVLAGTGLQTWAKTAADGAAATATAETVIGTVGSASGFAIGSCVFAPAAALTGDNTNNAVITVAKRTAATPGTPVTIASLTTNVAAGNWTAWKAVSLTVAAGAFVSPGDVLTIAITKGGTGVVVPQGQLEIFPTVT